MTPHRTPGQCATEYWNKLIDRAREINHSNINGMKDLLASKLCRSGYFKNSIKGYKRAQQWACDWLLSWNPWAELIKKEE